MNQRLRTSGVLHAAVAAMLLACAERAPAPSAATDTLPVETRHGSWVLRYSKPWSDSIRPYQVRYEVHSHLVVFYLDSIAGNSRLSTLDSIVTDTLFPHEAVTMDCDRFEVEAGDSLQFAIMDTSATLGIPRLGWYVQIDSMKLRAILSDSLRCEPMARPLQ